MSPDDDDSKKMFRELMRNVRPVKQDRVAPRRPKRKPIPAQSLRDQQAVVESLLSDDYDVADVETGDELLYAQPGLQHSVMRKLRRGHYAIEAQLDFVKRMTKVS